MVFAWCFGLGLGLVWEWMDMGWMELRAGYGVTGWVDYLFYGLGGFHSI